MAACNDFIVLWYFMWVGESLQNSEQPTMCFRLRNAPRALPWVPSHACAALHMRVSKCGALASPCGETRLQEAPWHAWCISTYRPEKMLWLPHRAVCQKHTQQKRSPRGVRAAHECIVQSSFFQCSKAEWGHNTELQSSAYWLSEPAR